MFQKIVEFLSQLDTDSIPKDRKELLQPLVEFVKEKRNQNEVVRINFICTHNSRRSHLAQIWAQTAAAYFEMNNISTYSAGTEATAVFPKIIETLEHTGLKITKLSDHQNPVYAIKFGENDRPIIGFSKVLDHEFNPQSGFAAVMTCDSANEACPFIAGAEIRIPITYNDPKVSDGTPEQDATYAERSKQIATDMKYIFEMVSK
ncbi:MAG: protein-tyrosine-phosphatase [Nonlabens sp.]